MINKSRDTQVHEVVIEVIKMTEFDRELGIYFENNHFLTIFMAKVTEIFIYLQEFKLIIRHGFGIYFEQYLGKLFLGKLRGCVGTFGGNIYIYAQSFRLNMKGR